MEDLTKLMTQIKLGNAQAFKDLFVIFYPRLCAVADRFLEDEPTSKDLVQEVFIKFWNKRDEWDTIDSVKSYLYTTTKNLCLNYIRDRVRNIPIDRMIALQEETYFEETLIEEEAITLLYQAIDNLPTQSSKIILYTLKGFKNQDIAQMMGVSVNTVKTLKYNALKSLRHSLGDIYLLLPLMIIKILF